MEFQDLIEEQLNYYRRERGNTTSSFSGRDGTIGDLSIALRGSGKSPRCSGHSSP